MKYLALIAALLSSPSYAQTVCIGTPDVYDGLTKAGESRQYVAQHSPDQLIELWAGKNGWTMFVTLSDGTSCLVSSGSYWQKFEEEPQL